MTFRRTTASLYAPSSTGSTLPARLWPRGGTRGMTLSDNVIHDATVRQTAGGTRPRPRDGPPTRPADALTHPGHRKEVEVVLEKVERAKEMRDSIEDWAYGGIGSTATAPDDGGNGATAAPEALIRWSERGKITPRRHKEPLPHRCLVERPI